MSLEAPRGAPERPRQALAATVGAAYGHPPNLPGEGIGLSIVKRLCELLDATVELESELGVGTRYRIRVPRSY